MTTRIALLRAVNVGGRTLAMAELRDLFAGLGLAKPRTLLQSGNVVFEGDGPNLEPRLEAAIEARFGFAADVLIRSAAEWAQIIAANPFPDEAATDPAHLLVMPLKADTAGDLGWPGPERIVVRGRTAYLVYPEGVGRSKLTLALVEKRLGARGTGRNWNTALKLAAMAGE